MSRADPLGGNVGARLPLPLTQILRRVQNAQSALERQHAALVLWQAAVRILSSTLIAEYAGRRGPHRVPDPELASCFDRLVGGSAGRWWMVACKVLEVLAAQTTVEASPAGHQRFRRARDYLLGEAHGYLPRATELDAVIRKACLRMEKRTRAAVRPGDIIDGIIWYWNCEIAYNRARSRSDDFLERASAAIFAGAMEILGDFDVLFGNRLIYISEVRRNCSGDWILDCHDLVGYSPRRHDRLLPVDTDASDLPIPGRVYLVREGNETGSLLASDLLAVHPLFVYDPDNEEFLVPFPEGRDRRLHYFSFTGGNFVLPPNLEADYQDLIRRVCG